MSITYLFLVSLIVLNSCGLQERMKPKKEPKHEVYTRELASMEIAQANDCFSSLVPILREGSTYADDSLTPVSLEERGLMELSNFDDFKSSEYWQGVVLREDMDSREEELGYMVLSLLKKKHKDMSNESLKDRYQVLMSFCGQ